MNTPTFVIVGNVNRGKSSVISTLAADESLKIGEEPGTTRACRTIPVPADGPPLFVLIDTPGFEHPRQVLQWLKQHGDAVDQRRAAVELFVRTFTGSGEFEQECRLLAPILDGGAILYVVDGSVPRSPHYDAEMEILRWTGQPSMSLVNRIHEEDYYEDWRPVLQQLLGPVRPFNAHHAGFEDRINLVDALSSVSEPWQAELKSAIAAMRNERSIQRREAAGAIAHMLGDMLQLQLEKQLGDAAPTDDQKAALSEQFKDVLRRREARCRAELQSIYDRNQLEVDQSITVDIDDDLFSEDVWNRLGLSTNQLAVAAAITGTVSGGAIDAMVAGHSFMLGAVIGGVAGYVAGRLGSEQIPHAKIANFPLGGRVLRIGPITAAAYPWIVLDRAWLFHDIIANTAHALRGRQPINEETGRRGRVTNMPADTRRKINSLLAKLRGCKNPDKSNALVADLTDALDTLLDNPAPERGK